LHTRENWGYNLKRMAAGYIGETVTATVRKMETQEEHPFGEYVEAWRGRLASQVLEQQAWAERLRKVAQSCAEHLVRDFGARRVYLFGSLLADDWVHDRSDIDLAVEGLEGRLYFKALGDLSKLLPAGVGLDLVILESSWPGLAERVRTEGVLLDAAA
jgi:predicted nucleotidyltransferase